LLGGILAGLLFRVNGADPPVFSAAAAPLGGASPLAVIFLPAAPRGSIRWWPLGWE
jgi:hypothetical protein